jgi:hypothetical protein
MRRGNGAGWGGAASGIPAGGHGWGGPARGASRAKRHELQGQCGPGRGSFSREGEARAERRARHVAEMCEILYEIAHNADEPGSLRIQAADKLLDRIEGRPGLKPDDVRDPIQIIIEGGLPSR